MDTTCRLRDYTCINVIGKGTYGTVYLCVLNSNFPIVLKQVPVNSTKGEDSKEVQNEIKVLAQLHHPNIIKYYESFYEDNNVYISIEYATHGDLADYMHHRRHYLIPQNEVLFFFCQILFGLQYIHKMHIIHRDIKAENIFLSGPNGTTIKIGDFGVAKILKKDKTQTLIGTPYYLAPELCENKPYNSKTDVWALGCLLYEMCTHHRAFDASTLIGLVKTIVSGNVAPINKQVYEYAVQDIIDNMLTVIPEKRCSVNDLLTRPVLKPILSLFFKG